MITETLIQELKKSQAQVQALSNNMDVLTKEQRDYIEFKLSQENMWQAFRDADICFPTPIDNRGAKYATESMVYFLIEAIQGKHNDFLQSIIDKK